MHDRDGERDWDRDEVVDLDGGAGATGNPALDVDGYASPKRTGNLTGFESHPVDVSWVEKSRQDRIYRKKQREAAAAQPRGANPRNRSAGIGVLIVVLTFVVGVFVAHPWLLLIFALPAAVGVCSLLYIIWTVLRRPMQAKEDRTGGEITESGAQIW
jgi:hypothetical protein